MRVREPSSHVVHRQLSEVRIRPRSFLPFRRKGPPDHASCFAIMDESSRDMFASSFQFNFVEKMYSLQNFCTDQLEKEAIALEKYLVYIRIALFSFLISSDSIVAKISISIWQPLKYCFLRFWRFLIDGALQSLKVEITAGNCLPTLCYSLQKFITSGSSDKITYRKIVKECIFTGINFVSSKLELFLSFWVSRVSTANGIRREGDFSIFRFFEIDRSIALFFFYCQVFRCFPCSCLFLDHNSPKPIFDRKNKISCSCHIEGLSSA